MVNFNTISADDGFFETTFDELASADLNNLPSDLIIDVIDTEFPNTRFSVDLSYLVIQLTHDIILADMFVGIENCKKALENYIFSLRNEGFFVYDNDVRLSENHLYIDWSFQRKLPVDTNVLLKEIREIFTKVEIKAKEIIQFRHKSEALQNK